MAFGKERPNCQSAWDERMRGASGPISWPTVWSSVGNPLCDPTEEYAWWKLVQRGWRARDRFPGKNHACRLGCGCAKESMQHMVECPLAAPLWRAVLNFCRTVLQDPGVGTPAQLPHVSRLIIFQLNNNNLLPPYRQRLHIACLVTCVA